MTATAVHPIARALTGASDEPDHKCHCLECGSLIDCPGFIWESVKLWNRQEAELAKANDRIPQFIRGDEIITCDACMPEEYARRRERDVRDHATTAVYLRELRRGTYNTETLAWLRARGHANDVTKALCEEGTAKAHG